jgi:hypothetical protein
MPILRTVETGESAMLTYDDIRVGSHPSAKSKKPRPIASSSVPS